MVAPRSHFGLPVALGCLVLVVALASACGSDTATSPTDATTTIGDAGSDQQLGFDATLGDNATGSDTASSSDSAGVDTATATDTGGAATDTSVQTDTTTPEDTSIADTSTTADTSVVLDTAVQVDTSTPVDMGDVPLNCPTVCGNAVAVCGGGGDLSIRCEINCEANKGTADETLWQQCANCIVGATVCTDITSRCTATANGETLGCGLMFL